VKAFERYDPETLRRAIHESGHCVATRAFGGAVLAATLCPNPALSSGGAVWPYFLGSTIPRVIRECMVVLASGTVAEAIWDPSLTTDAGSDGEMLEKKAWELIGRLGSREDVRAEIDEAYSRAGRLLRRHWSDVIRTAKTLLKFHTDLDAIKQDFDLARDDRVVEPAGSGSPSTKSAIQQSEVAKSC
jgi:hypothetical protein